MDALFPERLTEFTYNLLDLIYGASLMAQLVKNPPAIQDIPV